MREIVLDTETTGLDPASGDRIVEIGCVELVNHIPSGRTWHVYIDPERDMPQAAFDVHGLSREFLSGKPVFATVAADFLSFVETDHLVIHNAGFDLGFLNAELERAGHAFIDTGRVTDTLALARRKHPGSPNSLDALCRRYGVDNAMRTTHGALLDAELLAAVYVELIGGHQARLELNAHAGAAVEANGEVAATSVRPAPLPPRLTRAEADAHSAFVASLGARAIWRQYAGEDPAED